MISLCVLSVCARCIRTVISVCLLGLRCRPFFALPTALVYSLQLKSVLVCYGEVYIKRTDLLSNAARYGPLDRTARRLIRADI